MEIVFSKRTEWDITETAFAKELRLRKEAGELVADLTASNPTQCGFSFPLDLLAPLQDIRALEYDPQPRGIQRAREAVCQYYSDHGATIGADQVVLTTSTSEAYSFLFRLLCDPGDEVLISQPSYPLFDFLADLDDVRLVPYPLIYDHGWQLDVEGLRKKISAKTKAIALVHPNNPTGHFTKDWERKELERLCQEFGLALIVDEVFLDYSLSEEKFASFLKGPHEALTFVLSGLSKISGLPQMKAAWIACAGPQHKAALSRLEVIADTFLSMNAPVQGALGAWLQSREGIQRQIQARTQENLQELDRLLLSQNLVNRLDVEGGWYAVLRIPALCSDEETAVKLLRLGVSVHPGYFFGFAASGWLVLSLLGDTREFRLGVETILKLTATCGE